MKRFLLAYYIFLVSFFTLFSSGFVDSQDGLQYLAISRRIYYDHTFELPEATYPENNIHLSVTKNDKGEVYSPTGLGYSIALLPAVFIEDVLYRLAGETPLAAFPLQNDWPVLLVASMINSFFGALLVVTLYLFFRSFELAHKPAILYSLFGVVATNLFAYVKHVFPHMMFISFMMVSFYCLRRFGQTKNKLYIGLAATAFGVVILSYNPTYLLPLPALALYYLLQKNINLDNIRSGKWWTNTLTEIVLAVFYIVPFVLIYIWFNQIRFGGSLNSGYGTAGIPLPKIPPAYVFAEGFWGLLFSPGKSIFLFSPVLVLLITHWHKLTQKWRAELLSGLLLFATYFYFISTLLGDVDFLLWHGDSSWGPRYMLPTIPMLYIAVVGIADKLSLKSKWLCFGLLVVIGIGVQLPVMLLPYQIRFAGFQTDVSINGRNMNVYEYGNQIPRYSPVFNLAKTLVKRVWRSPHILGRGEFNLRLQDGFVRPFFIPGGGAWREPGTIAEINLDSSSANPIEYVEMRFRNHQMQAVGTASAKVSVLLNGLQVSEPISLLPNEEKIVIVPFLSEATNSTNTLQLHKEFLDSTDEAVKKKQAVFLQSVHINGQSQNISTIDYPYVSPVSKQLFGATYTYYGNAENDPWEIWHQHSGVYEETFDLWWLRPFHFWDLPEKWFALFFSLDISILLASGLYLGLAQAPKFKV